RCPGFAVGVERVRVHRPPAVVLAGGGRLLEPAGHARGGAAALDRRGRLARVHGCIFHRHSLPLGRRRPRDPRLTHSRKSVHGTACPPPCRISGTGSSRFPTPGSTWAWPGSLT